MSKFRFISDPGHGWLEVPLHWLQTVGLKQEITKYSYRTANSSMFYLEEDCDAPRFLDAFRALTGTTPVIEEVYQEKTFIRALPRADGRS